MSMEPLPAGTLLNGRYRILEIVGKGGMGTVYKAEHVRLDTILAVKEVRAQLDNEEERQAAVDQCEQEARFLVRLNHPNLPKVTDAFFEDDRFFLIMEFIEGVTLEARLKAAGGMPLEVTQVTEWALQVTDVLDYLHKQNPPIIFRDLKPSNIMLQPDGNIRLIDFGIARRFHPDAVKDTALLGSVGYSPPEQFGRHQTDRRSDIYAFGATLHHLLTGRDPSQSPFKFTPARVLNPLVPEMLSQLLDRCVRLDAEARPATINEVALELVAVHDYLLVNPSALPAVSTGESLPPGAAVTGSVPSGSANIILTNPGRGGTGRARTGSVSGSTNPSGKTSPSSQPPAALTIPSGETPNHTRLLLIAACLLLLVGGSTLAYVLTHSAHPSSTPPVMARTSGSGSILPNPVNPAIHPEQPPAPPPKGELHAGSPEHQTDPILFTPNGITALGVFRDNQGNFLLRLHVTGTVQNPQNSLYEAAAFFYDMNEEAIIAPNSKSAFANQRNGQLCVKGRIEMSSNKGDFETDLEIPIGEFPTANLSGIKLRCAGYINGAPAGTSEWITVPSEILINPTGHPGGL